MFEPKDYGANRKEAYELLEMQMKSLTDGEDNLIANLSNISALLFHFYEKANWCGFYMVDEKKENELVLGPFQGLPACIRIPFSKGVCGKAATTRESVLVANVHEFPGHIACDGATNSELVVPIMREGELIAVLDLDSVEIGYFKEEDKEALEKIISSTKCFTVSQ